MGIINSYSVPRDAQIAKECLKGAISYTRVEDAPLKSRAFSSALLIATFALNLFNTAVFYPLRSMAYFTLGLLTLPCTGKRFFTHAQQDLFHLAKSVAFLFELLFSLPVALIYPAWMQSHLPPYTPALFQQITNICPLANPSLANNCFMNAILQMLVHVPHLGENIIQQLPDGQLKTALIQWAREYCQASQDNETVAIHTQPIRDAISGCSNLSSSKKQEDATEFFSSLFSEMKGTDENPLMIGTRSRSTGWLLTQETTNLNDSALELYTDQSSSEQTYWKKSGKNPVQRDGNDAYESHISLALPPSSGPQEKILPLSEAIKGYFLEEHPTEKDLGKCKYCALDNGSRFLMTKTEHYLTAPPLVLPLSFKRFANLGRKVNKISSPVSVPPTYALFVENGQQKTYHEYRLQGFIVHQGRNIQQGHYVAYIFKNGCWYYASDSQIHKITEQVALRAAKQSYLLFYTYQNQITPAQAQKTAAQNAPHEHIER